MKKSITPLNLVLLITLTLHLSPDNALSQAPQKSSPANAAASKQETVFFDDFNGPVLDRSKWNVVITGRVYNNEQQAYVDSQETLYILPNAKTQGANNGALVIHPRFRPRFTTPEGKKFDFISGRIHTRGKMEFTYGTAAARIKLSKGSGLWPAFWALGKGRWPDCGEIDIMESAGEPEWTSVALHGKGYSGANPLTKKFSFQKGKDATGWHVYSVDWSTEELVFKIDGQTVYTVTRPTVEKRGKWAFDDPQYLLLNFALGGNYPMAVNKAKTPYPGLPESTVQLIRKNQSTMMIDWVRITKR